MDPEGRFADLIRDRTDADFVEREWLYSRIEEACASEETRYILVTGEPGAGKTSMMAGLARRHEDWLRYFVRRDSLFRPEETGLTAFLLAIGHQLARRRPALFDTERLEVLVRQRVESVEGGGRAVGIQVDHLMVSPFRSTADTAAIVVEQQVTHDAGEVIGLAAGSMTVDPRLEQPGILTSLALADPARLLLEDEPRARIIVLVDGIDELASTVGGGELLDWLLAGPELPPNVRVVLTSREHEILERLRRGRPGQVMPIRIDPGSRQVAGDVRAYAERALLTPPVTALARGRGHDPDDFLSQVVRQAAGNFQYLAAYRRALGDAIERDDGPAQERLLAFGDLPSGLDALYGVLMTTARETIERMRQADPLEPGLPPLRPWQDVGRPILAVLTVAREPLAAAEIIHLASLAASREAVGDVLRKLRMLLDVRDNRMGLFHASLAEFLASGDPADPDGPSWAVDAPYWHGRIVRRYRGQAGSWDAVDWPTVDRYGLVHLAWHLLSSPGAPAQLAADAVELVCPGLRQAIGAAFGSDRHFLRVAELVAGNAITRLPVAEALRDIVFLGVTRRQLLGTARLLPPAMLGLMARLGRVQEALERARASASAYQFEALREILQNLPDPRDPAGLTSLLAETALASGNAEHAYTAAEALAPHDLPRALRLWRRGRSQDRGLHPPEAPDSVYRAAAAAAEPPRAKEHIAQMRAGRCAAYLDLASRVQAEEAPGLLQEAEASLPLMPLGERLESRGRLAAAWRPTDPHRSSGHLNEIITESDRELAALTGEKDYEKHKQLANGLAGAAAALPLELREFARAFLGRLELLPVGGFVDDALVRAVGLWLDWGEQDRAQAIIGRVLAWNDTLWTTAKIARVIRRHAPSEADRLMEAAYGTGRRASPLDGIIGRMFGDGDQDTMALYLAGQSPGRAVEAARRIVTITWSPHETDRYTTLARIAHVQLDSGRSGLARQLLEEAERHAAAPPPLASDRTGGPFRRRAGDSSAGRADFRDQMMDMAYIYNTDQDWQLQRRQRFFQDPVDVVRAVLPGPCAVGNPHGWARTLRVLAETIAGQDHDRALRLVESLSDPDETAVGLAALVADAGGRGDRALEELRWRELSAALARIEPYDWIGDSQDGHVIAYLRPDHRARFDAASRVLPWDPDRGLAIVRDTGASYLEYAYQMSFSCWATSRHIAAVHRGAPDPVMERMHRMHLAAPPNLENHDPLLIAIPMARAAINERFICGFQGKHPEKNLGADIPDEVCAAFEAMVPSDGTARLGSRFPGRARALLGSARIPAVAELCAFAAEMVPAGDPGLRTLCEETLQAARTAPKGAIDSRLLVELCFAATPALADLVDVPDLSKRIEELETSTPTDYGRLRRDLFPVLLARDPQRGLRLLFHAVQEEWSLAMAMLESAAEWLVQEAGPASAAGLHEAIVRGLRCSSPPGSDLPATVDGVSLQLIAR